MKRYTITLGASTTAGGKVISASGGGSINGVQIAVEGDPIFCPACKSQGKILCVEPRIPESWNGKMLWSNLPGHLNRWKIHHLRRNA